MEKISVIVPVYKVEPYLRQCVDSILGQTFRNFELILVDDGSPDGCPAICDEYAAKDSRIIVIHQENGGLSAARNTGIDWVFANSDSQWIAFVDSDDALAPIMLETLFREVVKHQAEMATTYLHFFSDEEQLSQAGTYVGETICSAGKQVAESLYTHKGPDLITACGKLFRRNLFQDLRFPVGKIHEDQATTPILMYRAEKVVVIHSWLYYYRIREGSITHSDFSASRFDDIDAISCCISYFEAQGDAKITRLAKKYRKQHWARMTFTARQEGIYDQVPPQYRMSILQAGSIIFLDSLRRGGINFVAKRISNLVKQMNQQK